MGLFGGGVGTAIGAGLGYATGGAAGAAFGAGLGSGLDTNSDIANRADSSNAWSAAQYANRYQTTVRDLKAAGLNPMLAYSQGAGSAPTAQAVQFQNPVSSASQALSQYAGAEQSFASASQANAEAEKTQHVIKQVDATVEQIIAQTKKIPVEIDQIKFTIQKLAEEAANIAQDTENKTVLRKSMLAGISKLNAETSLLNNQVAVEQSLSTLGRTTKELAPAAGLLLDLIRSVRK